MIQAEELKLGYNTRDKLYYGKYKNPVDGKWKTKFIPASCGTEAEAKGWFASFLNNLKSTSVVPTNEEVTEVVHTVSTLYPLWEDYLKNSRTNKAGDKLDPSTIQGWLTKVRLYAMTHSVGALPLTAESFTPVAIGGWVEHLKKLGLAKYTVKDCVQALRTLIGDARKKGWVNLPFNPVADEIVRSEVPVGETRAGKNNPIHMAKEDACTLMACSSEGIPLYRKVKNVVALCTGARSGELQGLAWKHVDLVKGVLEIERQLKTGGIHPTFKAPKKKSYREIPLHPLALAALKHWKKMSQKTGDEDAVFPDPKTGLYAKTNAARSFRDDLRAADLSTQYQGKFNIDQHATRRTFRTLLADAGAPDSLADALMGHATRGVRRHYIKNNLDKFVPVIAMLPFQKVTLDWCK